MHDDPPERRPVHAVLACCVLVAAALAGGCTTKVKPYECADLLAAEPVDADRLWECHREIMVRVAKQKKFTIQEFESASRFFERLTAIPADSRPTPVGPVPGKGTGEDLRKWDAWREEHRIRWDPSSGEVKVAEDGQG